jgi:ubiquinone/menaquinone biosynthesis C-methylase UbiE
MMSDLARSIATVKGAWIESSYYEDAEKWTSIFWGKGSDFRAYFNRLTLTHCAELACGYGRHAMELMSSLGNNVTKLYCLDVVENNITKSCQRLSQFPQVECFLVSGKDFHPIGDSSLTAIYCYDAMVHFSSDIIESYLLDTYRVLSPGGQALYHHSNFDEPRTGTSDWPYGRNPHARNHMTFELFSSLVMQARLEIVESTARQWGGHPGLDRISLIRKPV